MGRTSRKEFVRQLADAICAGDLQTIEKILDSEPDLINAGTDPNQGVQPGDAHAMRMIHLAIAEAKVDVVRLLIERGVDLNVRNADGRLPLHDCFELDHDDFAKILLDAGAEPDVCAAAVYGMHDTLRQILKSDRKNANDLTTGESPLGWSAYGQQPKSAEILFKHGAVVDFAPYDGHAWRPAAMVASTDVTRVLLDHGANPNWLNDGGNTPMHCAITSRIVLDPTEFVEILLDSGADPAFEIVTDARPLMRRYCRQGRARRRISRFARLGESTWKRRSRFFVQRLRGHPESGLTKSASSAVFGFRYGLFIMWDCLPPCVSRHSGANPFIRDSFQRLNSPGRAMRQSE